MPVPTVYTPIQPEPSIVGKPILWTPNVWTAVQCPPIPPGTPEVFTVTVTNFTPVVSPAAYFGDPGLVVTLEAVGIGAVSGTAAAGTGVAFASVTWPGTITMRVTGGYTDYLFPNKQYKYRNDLPGGVVHTPDVLTGPSGYTATYGTLNQGTALTRGAILNPIGGSPTAGTPVVGMIEEIPVGHNHMQEYIPDPNYMIIVEYTVVITSSCGIGAGTFPIKQIVYDDKDIASARFVSRVNSQTGRIADNAITDILGAL
jgi:hypothetical protein